MARQLREFPDSWGADELTKFIDHANNNVVATHTQNNVEYPLLQSIDEIYLSMVRTMINPPVLIEAALLMRAHLAFRAALVLAMAGLNPETFAPLRTCLEIALYALHMNRNDGLIDVWLRRHDDADTLKKSKAEFQSGKVIATLEQRDPRNGSVARTLYERTIDFGAHPNERALTAALSIETDDVGTKLKQAYLSGGTDQQRHSLKTAAQVGLCSLYIFRLIFKERMDILGITVKLDELRERL